MTIVDGKITRFSNDHAWLSNFWPVRVQLEGVIYPAVENAYQAAKFSSTEREQFRHCSPAGAKALGSVKGHVLPHNWGLNRVAVMDGLLRQKFWEPGLRARLLATVPMPIIEGNDWNDTFWGVSTISGKGLNMLGTLIMAIRKDLAANVRLVP